MFADDTQIGTSSNNIDSIANILNEDLINVSDWMKANKLSLNASKTEYVVIGSHKRLHQTQSDPPITLGDHQIKRVKVTKSLGLMIDETLTWDEQVTLITKKVNKGLKVTVPSAHVCDCFCLGTPPEVGISVYARSSLISGNNTRVVFFSQANLIAKE
jgi:hypothetical protein